MTREYNYRIIFRPTKEMMIRIEKLLAKGRFKNQSDLVRNAIWLGLNKLEEE